MRSPGRSPGCCFADSVPGWLRARPWPSAAPLIGRSGQLQVLVRARLGAGGRLDLLGVHRHVQEAERFGERGPGEVAEHPCSVPEPEPGHPGVRTVRAGVLGHCPDSVRAGQLALGVVGGGREEAAMSGRRPRLSGLCPGRSGRGCHRVSIAGPLTGNLDLPLRELGHAVPVPLLR
ncbi:hypothetical protein ABT317_43700, partial [Streptomyces carpinensis]